MVIIIMPGEGWFNAKMDETLTRQGNEMASRTYTYYDADHNALSYGGAMSPASYFEKSTGLLPGRFIKGSGYVYGFRSDGSKAAVSRVVAFKNHNPSLHECSAKCRSAHGPNCECSCKGEFHGVNA